jgi:hypothetical protein
MVGLHMLSGNQQRGLLKKKALTIHPYFLTQDMAPNPFNDFSFHYCQLL